MRETDSDLAELQALLDRSYAAAGPHLLAIHTPERRLDARQVAERLTGMRLLALATATADGRPIVGPVDGIFLRGRSTSAPRRSRSASATSAPGRTSARPTSPARSSPSPSTAGPSPSTSPRTRAASCARRSWTSTSRATGPSGRRSSTRVRCTPGSTPSGCSRSTCRRMASRAEDERSVPFAGGRQLGGQAPRPQERDERTRARDGEAAGDLHAAAGVEAGRVPTAVDEGHGEQPVVEDDGDVLRCCPVRRATGPGLSAAALGDPSRRGLPSRLPGGREAEGDDRRAGDRVGPPPRPVSAGWSRRTYHSHGSPSAWTSLVPGSTRTTRAPRLPSTTAASADALDGSGPATTRSCAGSSA